VGTLKALITLKKIAYWSFGSFFTSLLTTPHPQKHTSSKIQMPRLAVFMNRLLAQGMARREPNAGVGSPVAVCAVTSRGDDRLSAHLVESFPLVFGARGSMVSGRHLKIASDSFLRSLNCF
jgi:hypothetical protein